MLKESVNTKHQDNGKYPLALQEPREVVVTDFHFVVRLTFFQGYLGGTLTTR